MFLLLSCVHLAAQDTIPLYELHFSQQIKKDLSAGKIRPTRAAWRYTYIGREREAIRVYDYDVEDRWGFDTLSDEELLDLRRYEALDARAYILEQAARHQILILNESHILPAHRHFLKQMLPELAQLGFQYFGLEALNNCQVLREQYPEANIPCDTALPKRGYPTHNKFDMLVVHPPAQYVFNRPTYLLNDPEKSHYFIPKGMISMDYPIIVKALDLREDKAAVPVDVVELRSEKDRTALVLPPGEHRLELNNPKGERQLIIVNIK